MKSFTKYGGVVASIILIAFGLGCIVVSANGKSEVRSNIKREAIVGTPDMTPKIIAGEIKGAGLTVKAPTCNVAGQKIDTGSKAKCFAEYMRIHTLEATGGKTYAEMPRYATTDGKGTNDPKAAAKDPKSGQPADNGARNIWVTSTALTTALNTSFFAESVASFSTVMGIALLLVGIGFLVLTFRLPWREDETAAAPSGRTAVAAK